MSFWIQQQLFTLFSVWIPRGSFMDAGREVEISLTFTFNLRNIVLAAHLLCEWCVMQHFSLTFGKFCFSNVSEKFWTSSTLDRILNKSGHSRKSPTSNKFAPGQLWAVCCVRPPTLPLCHGFYDVLIVFAIQTVSVLQTGDNIFEFRHPLQPDLLSVRIRQVRANARTSIDRSRVPRDSVTNVKKLLV